MMWREMLKKKEDEGTVAAAWEGVGVSQDQVGGNR